MNSNTRDTHRAMDRQHAEAQARDGGAEGGDILWPRKWRTDTGISGGRSEAKVLLLQLSERTSARGNRYYRGWLGRAAVVGFPGEPDEAGNQTIDIYVSTPQPRENRRS
jgi:hypothetical protein